jgi:hypothetical protein
MSVRFILGFLIGFLLGAVTAMALTQSGGPSVGEDASAGE